MPESVHTASCHWQQLLHSNISNQMSKSTSCSDWAKVWKVKSWIVWTYCSKNTLSNRSDGTFSFLCPNSLIAWKWCLTAEYSLFSGFHIVFQMASERKSHKRGVGCILKCSLLCEHNDLRRCLPIVALRHQWFAYFRLWNHQELGVVNTPHLWVTDGQFNSFI